MIGTMQVYEHKSIVENLAGIWTFTPRVFQHVCQLMRLASILTSNVQFN